MTSIVKGWRRWWRLGVIDAYVSTDATLKNRNIHRYNNSNSNSNNTKKQEKCEGKCYVSGCNHRSVLTHRRCCFVCLKVFNRGMCVSVSLYCYCAAVVLVFFGGFRCKKWRKPWPIIVCSGLGPYNRHCRRLGIFLCVSVLQILLIGSLMFGG